MFTRTHTKLWLIAIQCLVLAAGLAFTTVPAQAAPPQQSGTLATFTVNSINDVDDGTCDATHCSLREAINAANLAAGADTILFSVSGTITLTGPLPTITGSLTITGPGTANLIIDGVNAYRPFLVNSGLVTISGLTVRNGYTAGNGGGLLNQSANLLTLTNVVFQNNAAANGGGVYNDGSLSMTNGSLTGNTASANGGGLCLAVNSPLTLNTSGISGNSAVSGGGLYINPGSVVTLSSSTISSNQATDGAGVYNLGGQITASGSTFNANLAAGNGGAFYNLSNNTTFPERMASLFLGASQVTQNQAVSGGGVYNVGGQFFTNNTLFQSNAASGSGGGVYNVDLPGSPPYPGSVALVGGSVQTNSAPSGGGVYSDGSLDIESVTIENNGEGARIAGGILNARTNTIRDNGVAGLVFASGNPINAVVSGAPAFANGFSNNGPGGMLNILVTAPNTNPNINALWNNWGVNALQDIENRITHRYDNIALTQVDYYSVTLAANPLIQVADGVSTVDLTATLSSWITPIAGDTINFSTNLGNLGSPSAITDGSGQAVNTLTSPTPGIATVTAWAGADPLGTRIATVAVEFTPRYADLSITKTDGQASAVPGTNVTYTIVVANAGPHDAGGSTLTDIFPAALSGVTWTCSAAGGAVCPPNGSGDINVTLPALPVGGTLTFTASGLIDPAATGTLVNTASAALPTGGIDTNPNNNSATDSDSLTPEANLAITKGVDPLAVAPGRPLTYTLTYQNIGPSLASGVVITDLIPATIGGLSFSFSGATITDTGYVQDYVWDVQPLAPGAGGVITVFGTLATGLPGGTIIGNTASIAAATTDTVPGNNQSTVNLTVLDGPPVLGPIGDQAIPELTLLSFTATATEPNADPVTFSLGPGAPAGASITAGGAFTWTPTELQGPGVYPVTVIVTENNAPNLNDSETINITVEEVNVTPVVNAGPDQSAPYGALVAFSGSFTDPDNQDSHTITWDFGDGFTAAGTLTPTHTFPGSGVYTVTLTVEDSHAAIGSDTAVVTILLPQADVSLALNASSAQALVCTTLVYTLTASNSGPQDASGLVVTLALPNEVVFVSAPAGCFANSGIVTCSLSGLSFGQQAVLPIYARVTMAGSTLATASIAASETDPDPQNNSAAASVETLDELTVLVEDFEAGVNGNWLPNITSVTPTGRGFLGEFSSENVALALSSLPAHCSVSVAFDLFLIRSWDGNQVEWGQSPLAIFSPDEVVGPDSWQLLADGQALLTTTFSNWDTLNFLQSYPGDYLGSDYPAQTGAAERDSLGYIYISDPMDSVYHLTYAFAHLSDSLQVDFTAWGLQAIDDESWGIDNVTITLGGEYTPSLPPVRLYLPVVIR